MFRNTLLTMALLGAALPASAQDTGGKAPTSRPTEQCDDDVCLIKLEKEHECDDCKLEKEHGCTGCKPDETKFLTLEMGADLTTAYYARGILQENKGVIGQPWAEVKLHLFQYRFVSDVFVFVRTWNSLHTGPSGNDSKQSESPNSWYETQFSAGLGIRLWDILTVSGGYTLQASPNDRFETVQEAFLRGQIDDGRVWELDGEVLGIDWSFDGIRPSGGFVWELAGQRDSGRNRGVYAEVGINPGVTLKLDDKFTAKLSVPINVGLNIFEYYEVVGKGDAPYGYTSMSFRGEIPLQWIPSRYGSLSIYGQGTWYHFDQNLAQLNGSSNNDDYVASGGLRFAY